MKTILVVPVFVALLTPCCAFGGSSAGSVGADPDSSKQSQGPGTTRQSAPADSLAVADSMLVFRIEVGNRMFPDWKEEQRIRLGESFRIGDTETWALSPVFMPDFRIVDRKVISASRSWNNPAIQILVYEDSTAVDSSWAFRDFPPHYSQRSFFTFKLLEILLPPKGEAR